MIIRDGICYANNGVEMLEIIDVKVCDNMILIATFNTNEERIFDATVLLKYPVFQPLKDPKIFKECKVMFGTVTWADGAIDIAPETLYELSY